MPWDTSPMPQNISTNRNQGNPPPHHYYRTSREFTSTHFEKWM